MHFQPEIRELNFIQTFIELISPLFISLLVCLFNFFFIDAIEYLSTFFRTRSILKALYTPRGIKAFSKQLLMYDKKQELLLL